MTRSAYRSHAALICRQYSASCAAGPCAGGAGAKEAFQNSAKASTPLPALFTTIARAASSPFRAHSVTSPMSPAQTFAASRAFSGCPSGYSAASMEKTKSAMLPPTNSPPRTPLTAHHVCLCSPGRTPEELTGREIGEHRAYLVRGLLLEEVECVVHHLDQAFGEGVALQPLHPRVQAELVQTALASDDHLDQAVLAFRLDGEGGDFFLRFPGA